MPLNGYGKVFLLLQGPHGPFFGQLAKALRQTGAQVWRIGFNNGDKVFWPDKASFIPFLAAQNQWEQSFLDITTDKGVTDIVLYGDTRPIHAIAIKQAKARGLNIHVFEEGYLRPYWASYERNGSNGHSEIMHRSIDEMHQILGNQTVDLPEVPSRWGDMRQHMFWGALYHWCVWSGGRKFPQFRAHRALTVKQEFTLYLQRFFLLPVHALERNLANRRVNALTSPYHLVILQLEHDASFRDHSPFSTMREFLDLVCSGFAQGAPQHHHLVFKAHPLEDGRIAVKKEILKLARQYGIEDRVHFVRGGKLAVLLKSAHSAVTVNSTAGQQVLWRGMALRAFGTAVYSKPELVSNQSARDFFASPQKPDPVAYRIYRHYLLETSQIPGGFYSSKARRELLRHVIDLMLLSQSPYRKLEKSGEVSQPQLRLLK